MIRKVLKYYTICLWILILGIWVGNIWLGIPASVSDDVSEGKVTPLSEEIHQTIANRRLLSLLFLIPALGLFGLILHTIKSEKHQLFYLGMILTMLPLLILAIIGFTQSSEMPYKNLILSFFTILLIWAISIGLKELLKQIPLIYK